MIVKGWKTWMENGLIIFRFTRNKPWLTKIGLFKSLRIQKRVFLPSLTGTVSSSWAGNFLYIQVLIKEQILRSSRMGILGQHITGLAENMRPAFDVSVPPNVFPFNCSESVMKMKDMMEVILKIKRTRQGQNMAQNRPRLNTFLASEPSRGP